MFHWKAVRVCVCLVTAAFSINLRPVSSRVYIFLEDSSSELPLGLVFKQHLCQCLRGTADGSSPLNSFPYLLLVDTISLMALFIHQTRCLMGIEEARGHKQECTPARLETAT